MFPLDLVLEIDGPLVAGARIVIGERYNSGGGGTASESNSAPSDTTPPPGGATEEIQEELTTEPRPNL